VTVRDGQGTPLPNVKVTISFAATPGIQLCLPDGTEDYDFEPGVRVISGLTDAQGRRTFHIRAGGVSAAAVATVTAGTVLLGTRSVACPDQDGDMEVGAPDFLLFGARLGTTDPAGDFDCSGLVNTADMMIFSPHFDAGHACPPSAGVDPAVTIGQRPRLHACEPQPARGATMIRFDLPRPARVAARIIDLGGRVVRILVDGRVDGGRHAVPWDGRDETGRPVPAGMYLVALDALGTRLTTKTALLR
jgi:hypothetical protein